MLKVRGLSIESRSSTICIDLSMHVRGGDIGGGGAGGA